MLSGRNPEFHSNLGGSSDVAKNLVSYNSNVNDHEAKLRPFILGNFHTVVCMHPQ